MLGLLALALVVGLGWWWKSRPADRASTVAGASAPASGAGGSAAGRRFAGVNRVQPVSVQTVRRRDLRVMANAIGTINASNTATVHAQVSGVLQQLAFKEGQQVTAGQLLAQIDPRAFQAALGQAEGTLARDKAQLDNARVDLARYRELLAKDAIATQQVDTQEALVRQLEGTVKADQATVDSARLQLSYTRVTAPIAGRVGLKQVDLGNVVQPTDANGVVTITQTRPIALIFSVPAAQLAQVSAKLRANEPLPVEAWDRNGSTRLAVGRVATADNAIDVTTDTIKLKALFDNNDDALYPNQAVSVQLQLDVLRDALVVPSAAVLRGAQGFYVYVVGGDSSVSSRTIKTGPVDGDWMAVEGALQPGDKVVIDGVDRLRDGAKVEVIEADPGKRAGASAPAGGARAMHGAASAASAASGARMHPSRAASAPSAASAAELASNGDERPRWMDRLPPEVADKLMKMSPDERQAWIQKRREERARSGNTSAN
jgi:multidrug efflux system membrane fusion protein